MTHVVVGNLFKTSLDEWLKDIRALPELHIEPVTADIAQLAGTLESEIPGDPADRIIVATAIVLETKLVTADERLSKSPDRDDLVGTL